MNVNRQSSRNPPASGRSPVACTPQQRSSKISSEKLQFHWVVTLFCCRDPSVSRRLLVLSSEASSTSAIHS